MTDKPAEVTALVEYDSKLPAERHAELVEKFKSYGEDSRDLMALGAGIEVNSSDDTEQMALAKRTRLDLVKIRTGVEKTRKELKAESLLFGKAVDGMARVIVDSFAETEAALKEKEEFAKREEEAKIAELIRERTAQLEAVEVDVEHYDLGSMKEEAFESLLDNSRAGHEARKQNALDEQKRIADEKLAREKAEEARLEKERLEREKLEKENEKSRKRESAAKAKLETERKAREKSEAETARLKREAAEKEQAAKDAEAQRLRDEQERIRAAKQAEAEKAAAEKQAELDAMHAAEEDAQRKLAAPDKEKLEVLHADICAITFPSVSSEIARAASDKAGEGLTAIVVALHEAIVELGESDGS